MASPLISVLLKLSFSEASGPYDLGEEVPPLLNRPGYVFRLQENLRHILPRSHLEPLGRIYHKLPFRSRETDRNSP